MCEFTEGNTVRIPVRLRIPVPDILTNDNTRQHDICFNAAQVVRSQPTSGTRPTALTTPTFIPTKIDVTKLNGGADVLEGEDPLIGFPTGDPNGTSRVLEGFAKNSQQGFVPPTPPPPSAVQAETHVGPVRRGGDVQNANLVYQVKPDYPHLARVARIQGAVILEAIIDREGRVENLQVLSGHPLLIQAARDAVQQWRYRPTLLNGEPIEVLTQVTVNFSLGAP